MNPRLASSAAYPRSTKSFNFMTRCRINPLIDRFRQVGVYKRNSRSNAVFTLQNGQSDPGTTRHKCVLFHSLDAKFFAPIACNFGVKCRGRGSRRPVDSRVEDRRQGDPPQLVDDSTLAFETLGWKPQITDIESIIRSAWEWKLANPTGYPE